MFIIKSHILHKKKVHYSKVCLKAHGLRNISYNNLSKAFDMKSSFTQFTIYVTSYLKNSKCLKSESK